MAHSVTLPSLIQFFQWHFFIFCLLLRNLSDRFKDSYLWRVIEFEVQRSKYYSYVHARNKTFDVGLDIRVNITFWYWNCKIGTNWHFLKKSRVFCVVCLFSPFEICHTKEVRVSCLWAHKSHIRDLRSQQSSWWWHYTSRKLPSTIQWSPGDPGWV